MKKLEQYLQETADAFPYPATPDLTRTVAQRLAERPLSPARGPRQLTWAIVTVLVILGSLMIVPQVRATVLEMFRIGAVTIFVDETAATVTPVVSAEPPFQPAIFDELAGATTLVAAQAQVAFPLRLPDTPSDLGLPDHVFFQDVDGPVVIMIWLEPKDPDRVRLGLYQIGIADYGLKRGRIVESTTVNGRGAVWLEDTHPLQLRDGTSVPRLFVDGTVLLWAEEGVTYRLESGLMLKEAVRIAESLEK